MKCNTAKLFWILGAAILAASAANATDLVWIGGTGNWDATANWSPAQLPAAADNVFITNNGPYTVTVPNAVNPTVGRLTLGGTSGTQTLSLGRSILTLNGTSGVNANGILLLTVGNSTVTGGGNLTVNGTLNWASGTISGAGATTIGSGGALIINGGVSLTTRTLINGGHTSWDSGNLTASSGAVITNLAGAIFDINFDGRLNVGTAPATFNNAGSLRKTAGIASANLIIPVNNSGTADVQSGTLSLDNGGTHSGTFKVSAGATLNLGGGTHTLSAATVISGPGTLGVSGGSTVTASGNFNPGSTLNATAGTVTLAPSCNVTTAAVSISGAGGTVLYNSAGTVGTLNLSAGTLGGTSPVTVTGLLTLAGGAVTNALVTADGGISINGGVTLNGGKLVNPGTAIWSLGNITGANGAGFTNLLGATFINTFDGNMPSGAGATPLFVNEGLFQKTGGTAALGTTSIDFDFINLGTVEVQTNTLRYNFNQQLAGLTLLDGGSLSAKAGGGGATAQPIQLLGGSLVGTGLVTVANTVNVINSAAISPGLSAGELDLAGNYQQTASGVLNIELGGYSPGAGFDLVTVTAGGAGGVATLGGTLDVTLLNGFSPTNGATFTFLTAVSRAGAFATFNYPSNDIGMQVSYDLTSAKVTVSNLKPVVANPMVSPAPITYGAAYNFQFPLNTFSDPDNNQLTYTASGMPAGISFTPATRTFSGTPTQAGAYLVAVAATDNGTPSLSVTNTFTITINKATPTATLAVNNSPVSYAGLGEAASVGIVSSSVPGVVANTLTGGTATKTNAGTYAVTADFVPTDTANYTSLLAQTVGSFVISKATLSATAGANSTIASKIYNASNTAGAVTVGTLSGFVGAETVSATATAAAYSSANAGTYPGVVITYTLADGANGGLAANYRLPDGTATGTITQATTASVIASSGNPALPGAIVAFTHTLSVVAPGAGTPSSSVQFRTNDVAFGGLESLSGLVATSRPTALLSHGSNTVTAEYAGDSNFVGITNSLVQIVNSTPTIGTSPVTYERGRNTAWRIALADLITVANATDGDGDMLTISALGSPTLSGSGATVFFDGTYILYTPPPSGPKVDAGDSFTYTLSDSHGGFAQGTINITVATTIYAAAQIILAPIGNTVNLKFTGLPFRTYEVQWSSAPNGPWTTVASQSMNEFGVILYSTNSPPNLSFWRALRP